MHDAQKGTHPLYFHRLSIVPCATHAFPMFVAYHGGCIRPVATGDVMQSFYLHLHLCRLSLFHFSTIFIQNIIDHLTVQSFASPSGNLLSLSISISYTEEVKIELFMFPNSAKPHCHTLSTFYVPFHPKPFQFSSSSASGPCRRLHSIVYHQGSHTAQRLYTFSFLMLVVMTT